MKKDDLTKVAVYFNDEYIGEAIAFEFNKGEQGFMGQLDIEGDFQFKPTKKNK